MDKSAIDLIQQTAIDAASGRLPSALRETAAALPTGYNIHNLEPMLPNRSRFRGRFATASLPDFVGYVKRHMADEVFLHADAHELSATAFFNLGDTDGPGHADWTGQLLMETVAPYAAILDANGRPHTQNDLIALIEDWPDNFGAVTDAGEEIKLSKAIAAIRKVKIEAKSSTETQQQNFGASASRLDSVTASSDEGLPDILTFRTGTFHGLAERVLRLRLSVSSDPSRPPALGLRIIGLEALTESIAREFKTLLIAEIGDAALVTIGCFSP